MDNDLFIVLRKYPCTDDNETAVTVAEFFEQINERMEKRMEAIENNRKATSIGPVRELRPDEKASLAPPHPGDFGIPKEHWKAAKYYAEYWHENQLKVYGIGGE